MRHVRQGKSLHDLVFAKVALDVSSLIDYVSLLLVFPLSVYLLIATRGNDHLASAKRLVTFLVPFLAIASVNLAYNFVNFGSVSTFAEQFWGVNRLNPTNGLRTSPRTSLAGVLGGFSLTNLAVHAIFSLVSPWRGLLLLSPVLIL